MCFKRRTSLPAGFTHRGNSTRYVLCSSNQSHSNITTPQEIQSLPTKQMKICLPRRKSFMIGDCCKWTAHLYSYANQKYTPWTPQHKKILQRAFTVRIWSTLWVRHDTECFNPQTIITDPRCYTRFLPKDSLWYIHCHLLPCDSVLSISSKSL